MNKAWLGAVATAAVLALPASWLPALPAAATQPTGVQATGVQATGVQVTAGPPPAVGRYSTIAVPGGTQVRAEGISDSGVIVGCYLGKTSTRAFVDRHGRITTFADPAVKSPHGVTCAEGIDDAGAIVGYYQDGAASHGFVDRNGRFTSITAPAAGTRAGQGTIAVGINRSGVVVGYYVTRQPFTQRGFVLKNGKFSTIKVPLSDHSHPAATALNAIADDGTISGIVDDPRHHLRSFIERAGKFTALAVPGRFQTVVACISERGGFAVGTYYQTDPALGPPIGFTYRAGVYHNLRDPSGPRGTIPQGGNAAGYVVGYLVNSRGTPRRGFLFTPAKSTG